MEETLFSFYCLLISTLIIIQSQSELSKNVLPQIESTHWKASNIYSKILDLHARIMCWFCSPYICNSNVYKLI